MRKPWFGPTAQMSAMGVKHPYGFEPGATRERTSRKAPPYQADQHIHHAEGAGADRAACGAAIGSGPHRAGDHPVSCDRCNRIAWRKKHPKAKTKPERKSRRIHGRFERRAEIDRRLGR